ncbi:MAG: galactokinase [Promethearchaeota archaeon]
MEDHLKVSAPGRICLFGEHQDYLELAVIPAAINMRTYIEGKPLDQYFIRIHAHDLNQVVEFGIIPEQVVLKGDALDYMRAVVNVFLDKGYRLRGTEVHVRSEIPLKSGLSSSAALLVAWTKFISEINNIELDDETIGHYAYLAEHDVMGIPCGQMDQLASAIGGLFHMKCVEPPVIQRICKKIPGLVIGDTLIPKSTNSVHTIRVREINEALQLLRGELEFSLGSVKWDEVEPHLPVLTETLAKRVRATLMDRDITSRAFDELKKKHPDLEYLGKLLDEHQGYLRDDFEVSLPKIDALLDAGREAGALGGKLTGAGMGGFIVMLAPDRQDEVASAITRAGGKGYVVEVDEGVKIE